ncbi:hypothetical protein Q9V03_000771 [Salmonella enterica]|nr:hypothetical protein [Salmonella enterica]ECO7735875.1 hypothetical protein [Salmonella enterica]EDZ7377427.1 hypothetical protein [Salmonella enterica]EEK5739143.1 hypothetical protein [Salmonella enterica]EEL9952957.1 hypothetical protein [Salmonella enterica]
MKFDNAIAFSFAVQQTLEHMVEHAGKHGKVTTVAEISETIVRHPHGGTANFFRKHMEVAYKVAIEVSLEKVVN